MIPLTYSLYLPKDAVDPNKKTRFTPGAALVPVYNTGKTDPNKCSPPLDVSYNFLNSQAQYPTTILVAVSRKTPITDTTNTPVDPTEALKTTVSDITEDLLFLIAPISYET